MIGKLVRLVLIAAALAFGALVVYRRQALQKVDAAVALADDEVRKYEAVEKDMRKRKGAADDQVDELGRRLVEVRRFRDGLAAKRERMKRFL